MSRDIRSFFKLLPSKNSSPKASTATAASFTKKRPLVVLSSDEDIIDSTPEPPKKPISKKRKTLIALSSDSEEDTNKKPERKPKKTINETLKPINALDVLGSTPVKQSKVEIVHRSPETPKSKETKTKKTKKGKNKSNVTELGIHEDANFEKTLMELDDDFLIDNVDIIDKSIGEVLNRTPKCKKTDDSISENNHKHGSPQKSSTSDEFSTPKRKRKVNEDCSYTDPDQERYEKKRESAILYQKYKNRSGPAHLGSKELPEGKPDCLKNLCFLRTGVLDSLESEQFDDLVKKHGGRTVKAVSRKINYLVVGDEPGPAKLEKARSYGIPTISEDEFLDLICTKSGMKPVYARKVDDEEDINSDFKRDVDVKIELKCDPVEKQSAEPVKKQSSPLIKKKNGDVKEHKPNSQPNLKNLNINIDISITNEIPEETVKPVSNGVTMLPKVVKKHEKIVHRKDMKPIERLSVEIPAVNMSWTEKYKPTDTKSIIGQQGDKSCMKKLMTWLNNWHKHHSGNAKTKMQRPSFWSKNDDGAYFKCALLSGSPGVGKTTTATLVAKELGFDVVEFNASDTRSKRLLHEEVSQLLSTTSLSAFAKEGLATTRKRVLLMDEVDGMAGNEDRGGIQELINLIKNTNVPIICMCNDRHHQKMRSLVNYCFDLRFTKPRLEQIKGAMMSVCFKEGIKISSEALTQIINGTGLDVRQTLNHLSVWTSVEKTISTENAQKEANVAKKDAILGPWEVCRKVFSEEDHKNMSLADKFHLFFYDYNIGPLFIQENYLQVVPHVSKKEVLTRVANTADSISMGDIISRKIRTSNNWSLLEVQALYSSVLPGHYMEGHVGGRIDFPSWLGKNSSKNKKQRLLSEIHSHTRLSTSGSKLDINLDYRSHLYKSIVNPLISHGLDGVDAALNMMKSYSLMREDLDSLSELSKWRNNSIDLFSKVDSKVKAAFTRAYNKRGLTLPYAIATKKKPSSAAATQEDYLLDEDEAVESNDEDDNINNNGMIKVIKKTAAKSKNEKNSEGEASTSKKKKTTTKGRGKKK